MKKIFWDYIYAILIILNGVLCIFNSAAIYKWLPSICGIVLLIIGSIKMIEGIKEKDYASLEVVKFERSIVVIAMGIGILIRQGDELFIVGVFWGLSGLNKSVNYFNEAFYYFSKKEKFLFPLIKGIIEFTLSLILLFDPFTKILEHIRILGLELIVEGIFDLPIFTNEFERKQI